MRARSHSCNHARRASASSVESWRISNSSGIYSNFGPVNGRFEAAVRDEIFGGTGGCLTVANATIGLMLAIREQVSAQDRRRFAVMPSFTFAATAQAAMWCGLTPLFVDVDPETWMVDPAVVAELLVERGEEISCLVPYACFGNELDLDQFADLASQHQVGVVVDAAASLGSRNLEGVGSGAGFERPVVFSMHATKTFATAEAGLIYAADLERIDRLRAMANFGFGQPRVATMPGLNGKLDEVTALLGLQKLAALEQILEHRSELAIRYRARLPLLQFQRPTGSRQAHQFMPVLLPIDWRSKRDPVIAAMAVAGVDVKRYFSPHLAQQPYFCDAPIWQHLSTTDDIAKRTLSLPLSDDLSLDDVDYVCEQLLLAMEAVA